MPLGVYVSVAMLTAVFVIFSFVTDIRERVIYSFPCMVLFLSWTVMGIDISESLIKVAIVAVIHLAVYGFLRATRIWGDGDSDLFLLYGAIYGVHHIWTESTLPVTGYVFWEVIGIMTALILSLLIGWMEALIRRKELEKGSSIAVVPGFTIVIIAMLIHMFIGR